MTQAAQSNHIRFERRTTLAAHEYRKNFHQIDIDVVRAVTSPEADAVTPLMSKIYLRLVDAPAEFWEQKGVLHFSAQVRGGKLIKASDVLCAYLSVTRTTFNKARKWMHEEGVIGYFAAKNGVGIRIFLNRAASSIGTKPTAALQKILQFSHGTFAGRAGTQSVPAFNDPFGDSEISDTEENRRAPKNGADTPSGIENRPENATSATTPVQSHLPPTATADMVSEMNVALPPIYAGAAVTNTTQPSLSTEIEGIITRLKRELEPSVRNAAAHAATRAAAREHAQTRQWLDRHGIPKATRVAQKEAFKVLRSHGVIDHARERARADLAVGRPTKPEIGDDALDRDDGSARMAAAAAAAAEIAARPLTPEEVAEAASTCFALYETQGREVEETLRGISVEAGGWVLAHDVLKVREATQALILGRGE